MNTIPKSQATHAQVLIHRHMQRKFLKHRHKFAKHRAKGPAFAARLDELEAKLFGPEGCDSDS